MEGDVRGRFLWHELSTTDPDAASRFYGSVAGWETIRWDQDADYRLLATAGVPMAGLINLAPENRPRGAGWLSYIGVTDVDAAVRLATGMGAAVRAAAHDVPTVGRMAELTDPQGAAFAVYTPTGDQVPADAHAPGDFSWHELATSNWQAAWDFYAKLFGWEHESSFDMGPAGTYWMFRRPGGKQALGGMYTRQPDQSGRPSWLPYILVPSADRASEAAVRGGGTIIQDPMEVPGGSRTAIGSDPQGGVFAVHSLKPATKKAAAKKPGAKKPATQAKRSARPKAKKKTAKKATRAKRRVAAKRR
jgi:predicted enzyme related to lactoylglutathione lyase